MQQAAVICRRDLLLGICIRECDQGVMRVLETSVHLACMCGLGRMGTLARGRTVGLMSPVSTSTWCSSHCKESAMPGTVQV